MKRLLFFTLGIFTTLHVFASTKSDLSPKLVVGIVIDQMRFDYLYRYYDHYSQKGLKRIMGDGMNFTFAHYNYVPTYTGPGHASIYTGTTPFYHGIISNDWYDKKMEKSVYCVSDTNFASVGANSDEGKMSPKNLLTTTITDQLRLSNNGLSRVFSASIKDRASVIPGGHMANAAYWYDGKTGKFISSTYYMQKLPDWVNGFNAKNIPLKLMSGNWSTALPESDYKIAMPDSGFGETDVFKEGKTTFPHNFSNLTDERKLGAIRTTPFGNELLTDFVIDLIGSEKIGGGNYTDFLAISYSSTDYVGHAYGPNSMEVMDTYIRLDSEIARLLDVLDKAVGAGNYLLFFTADHAVKPTRAYLNANTIEAGSLSSETVEDSLRSYCKRQFGNANIIKKVWDNQIYFDNVAIEASQSDQMAVYGSSANYLHSTFSLINTVCSVNDFRSRIPTRTMSTFLLNGWNPSRSGDVVFELAPGFLTDDHPTGTSHGSSYSYDTHVPMIFYGWHVPSGESNELVFIEDIAPTIANLIHIQEPSGTLGIPIIRLPKTK